ncbi:DUF6385 domain-containing protein [Fodinisporobacter ferrooxydans]|uniref:DUF6385 domain-containing protein n=1 Tax=Fodinisporobacter ferrooxydans TaxID=2901836 RepID=A0ABY4CEC2_9BACL|nr:DUF6385 domain-containing protein [Alicyclobacillaceae bacterium MYW30-H2]
MTEKLKGSKGRPMRHPLHNEVTSHTKGRKQETASGKSRCRKESNRESNKESNKEPNKRKKTPSILAVFLAPSPHTGTLRSISKPVTVKKIEQPITVKKIEQQVKVKKIEQQVDIRPLNPSEDGITIFGSNPELPVMTDDEGRLIFSGEVKFPPVTFTQNVFTGLLSEDLPQLLPSQDVSIQTTFSYAIINRSPNPVLVQLEISPNDTDYTVDSEMTIDGQTMKILTPLRFLKYSRIAYLSAESGKHASFDVYYQAQSG